MDKMDRKLVEFNKKICMEKLKKLCRDYDYIIWIIAFSILVFIAEKIAKL